MTRFRVESFFAKRFKKFSEISITFPSKWAIQLIGLNGAGKSTIGDEAVGEAEILVREHVKE